MVFKPKFSLLNRLPESIDDAADGLLDHLDLGARDPQLEVLKVFQADPLDCYSGVS